MQNDLHSEIDLLQQLADGDSAAINSIYKRHYKSIVGWILKNGGDEQDAADICQEAVVILYEKSKNEDFRLTCKVNTYLYAVTKNLWYKRSQQERPIYSGSDDELEETIVSNYEEDINAHKERELYYDQLDQALEQLGQPCSSLIRSFYYDNMSMQDIAAKFGYTNADNAKTQKYKCLSRLKKLFYGTKVK